jgi:hypothetical protein
MGEARNVVERFYQQFGAGDMSEAFACFGPRVHRPDAIRGVERWGPFTNVDTTGTDPPNGAKLVHLGGATLRRG